MSLFVIVPFYDGIKAFGEMNIVVADKGNKLIFIGTARVLLFHIHLLESLEIHLLKDLWLKFKW
jgi:hypothetical protein